jgi:hypothetical protein
MTLTLNSVAAVAILGAVVLTPLATAQEFPHCSTIERQAIYERNRIIVQENQETYSFESSRSSNVCVWSGLAEWAEAVGSTSTWGRTFWLDRIGFFVGAQEIRDEITFLSYVGLQEEADLILAERTAMMDDQQKRVIEWRLVIESNRAARALRPPDTRPAWRRILGSPVGRVSGMVLMVGGLLAGMIEQNRDTRHAPAVPITIAASGATLIYLSEVAGHAPDPPAIQDPREPSTPVFPRHYTDEQLRGLADAYNRRIFGEIEAGSITPNPAGLISVPKALSGRPVGH